MPASLADLYHLMSNASFAGTSTCEQSQCGTSFQHAIYSSGPKLYSDSNKDQTTVCDHDPPSHLHSLSHDHYHCNQCHYHCNCLCHCSCTASLSAHEFVLFNKGQFIKWLSTRALTSAFCPLLICLTAMSQPGITCHVNHDSHRCQVVSTTSQFSSFSSAALAQTLPVSVACSHQLPLSISLPLFLPTGMLYRADYLSLPMVHSLYRSLPAVPHQHSTTQTPAHLV